MKTRGLLLKIFLISVVSLFFTFINIKELKADEEIELISTVEDFKRVLTNASDGDTIYVSDIEFPYNNTPSNMIVISKSINIVGKNDGKSVFVNPMFSIYGNEENELMNVSFENIDFRGNLYGVPFDSENTPNVSSKGLAMLKTMYAFIFDRNAHVSFDSCNFEGYHYGYGAIFSATKYSSQDCIYQLKINLDNCLFKNNYSHHGGVAYLYGHDTESLSLEAKNCVFTNNYSATGGVIYAIKSKITLFNCLIDNNKFLAYEMSAKSNGGALALINCDTNIDGCLISNNETGEEGAAIYAEILPFKTLNIKNTTIVGNTGPNDNSLFINNAETNLDSSPKAYIYLSSVIGSNNFNNNVETFGCILTGSENINPNSDNKYNQYIKLDEIENINNNEHYTRNDFLINNDDLSNYLNKNVGKNVKFYVGDNYKKEVIFTIFYTNKDKEEVKLNYGEALKLDDPSKKGYEFIGWKNYDSEFVYMGGEIAYPSINAEYKFLILENWYITILPISIILIGALIVFILIFHKKKIKENEVKLEEVDKQDDSKDWIERACSNESIVNMLTSRELEVLKKLLSGESRKQIADELFISESTVKKHCSGIYEKFDVKNRSELTYKITKEY